ncbi:MAG TPA: hypothetical protein DEB39_04590, partial [Planctomycetaceae bacterium]|nr:hypothetical protein [Planctomycetaceae bacterium]
HYFPIKDKATILLVELDNARRTESLEAAAVASAMTRQADVQDRMTMNDMLKRLEDPNAKITAQSGYDGDTGGYAGGGGGGWRNNSAYPFY